MGRNTLVEYWVGDFSLSNDEARSAAIVSIVVLSFVGLASAITLTDKRRLAWCISLVNSGLLSAVGVCYLLYAIPHYPELCRFDRYYLVFKIY